ncbi:hypothetical protein BJV74DRAFT_860853 [Russula compacta]|nr:hypothetical protein BJV74DRAFT_860853 [Russula compacta]
MEPELEPELVPPKGENDDLEPELDAEVDEDHCAICLQAIADRAVIPTCSHDFCFECLLIWSEQSRRCPLCAQNIGDYLIHHIRSTYDYQKHFLPPLRTSPRPLSRTDRARIAPVHRRRERVWGPRDRAAQDQADALQRAVSRRRWVYQHNLYAKHVASNKYTRYRPYPTPTQLVASQDLISRMTVFLRRELLVWPNADVEFLVTFVISLMKSIDIRSESAIKLLAEFLDMDTPYVPGERHVNAEHFAHEIYCYLRSPYRDLSVYDSVVQYDAPLGIPPPPSYERTRRWESGQSPSRSQSPNLRQSHSRSRPPPSTGGWNTRPERSPQSCNVSREQDLGSSISPHSPAEVSRVPGGVSCRRYGEDDRPAARHCSRSPTRVKDKGKQRAPAPLLSPAPEFDILRSSPAARHERTGPHESSTTPTNLSLFQNTPEGSTAVSAAVDVKPGVANPPVFQTSENISAGTPVVSPQPLNGNPCTAQTTHSDSSPLRLEGPHSLNYGIITNSSSKSETPEPLSINLNHAPTNPIRQPRYRSQRDTIMAYLRTPSTMLRPLSSAQPSHAPSLLARMTDEAVAKPDVSGADGDAIERTAGRGRARLLPPRAAAAAERSSSPFVNDDPCGGEGTTAVTKAERDEVPPPRTSHVHLLDRLHDVEKVSATEARLRTQVRLRARLAAERQHVQDK